MFDFLRNLTKSEEEKRQETLSAYLDGGLTSQERLAFEEEMRADAALQASMEQQQLVKQNLSALPMMRAPRNFTLDPALYGRPTSPALFQLYPVMRTATAVAAIVLIFLFSLDLFSGGGGRIESDTLAQAPIAATLSMSEESGSTFSAEPAAGETAEEPMEAPAAEQEAADAIEETEMMAADVEEEMESVPEEEMMAEEAVVVEEPENALEEAGVVANDSDGALGGDEDGATTAVSPPLTPTQRLSQTSTLDTNGNNALYSDTQSIEGVEPRSDGDIGQTVPTRRILQIGLGVLFLALLAGTWFLRRQL